VTFACAIHKASYPQQDCVELAFEELSSRFDLFLKRKQDSTTEPVRGASAKGLIVLDKTAYEETLQNLVRSYRSGGNRWGSQLRQICEVPLFAESRASRIVQLADHIAHAVFRRYNAQDLTYFNCGVLRHVP
jgi:predicted RNA-binding protein Jag